MLLDAGVDHDVIESYLDGDTLESPIEITEKMNDKMHGLQSLSTSPLLNTRCQKNRCVDGSICQSCYSCTMAKRFTNLERKNERNFDKLTAHLLQLDEIPTISALYFRFEAFGDLQNEIQFINYVNICNANPNTHFALWTKNPDIIHNVLKGGLIKKPANLKILVSSLMKNTVRNVDKYRYFVDHVFTVYDLSYILEHPEIVINCGSRSCIGCLACYTDKNAPFEINELIKKDHKKAVSMGIKIG